MSHVPYWDPSRKDGEESAKIYPGLVVCDGRVTGSITAGRSRLSLWAIVGDAVRSGWDVIEGDYEPSRHAWDAEQMAQFLYCLMEHRGEYGRLVLELADAERADTQGNQRTAWYERKARRRRMRKQLQRCIDVLDRLDVNDAAQENP